MEDRMRSQFHETSISTWFVEISSFGTMGRRGPDGDMVLDAGYAFDPLVREDL